MHVVCQMYITLVINHFVVFIFFIASNHYACSTLRQFKFLSNLQTVVSTDEGAQLVIQDLEEVKQIFMDPNNIKMHLAADIENLCKIFPDASSMMTKLLPPGFKRTNNS